MSGMEEAFVQYGFAGLALYLVIREIHNLPDRMADKIVTKLMSIFNIQPKVQGT